MNKKRPKVEEESMVETISKQELRANLIVFKKGIISSDDHERREKQTQNETI